MYTKSLFPLYLPSVTVPDAERLREEGLHGPHAAQIQRLDAESQQRWQPGEREPRQKTLAQRSLGPAGTHGPHQGQQEQRSPTGLPGRCPGQGRGRPQEEEGVWARWEMPHDPRCHPYHHPPGQRNRSWWQAGPVALGWIVIPAGRPGQGGGLRGQAPSVSHSSLKPSQRQIRQELRWDVGRQAEVCRRAQPMFANGQPQKKCFSHQTLVLTTPLGQTTVAETPVRDVFQAQLRRFLPPVQAVGIQRHSRCSPRHVHLHRCRVKGRAARCSSQPLRHEAAKQDQRPTVRLAGVQPVAPAKGALPGRHPFHRHQLRLLAHATQATEGGQAQDRDESARVYRGAGL